MAQRGRKQSQPACDVAHAAACPADAAASLNSCARPRQGSKGGPQPGLSTAGERGSPAAMRACRAHTLAGYKPPGSPSRSPSTPAPTGAASAAAQPRLHPHSRYLCAWASCVSGGRAGFAQPMRRQRPFESLCTPPMRRLRAVDWCSTGGWPPRPPATQPAPQPSPLTGWLPVWWGRRPRLPLPASPAHGSACAGAPGAPRPPTPRRRPPARPALRPARRTPQPKRTQPSPRNLSSSTTSSTPPRSAPAAPPDTRSVAVAASPAQQIGAAGTLAHRCRAVWPRAAWGGSADSSRHPTTPNSTRLEICTVLRALIVALVRRALAWPGR